MKRREFLTLLSGAAAASPAVWAQHARAQQTAMPVIGWLHSTSVAERPEVLADFRRGLAEMGYVEGQNVVMEYRWAQAQYERMPELAADLVRRRVALIVTPLSAPGALAAKAATSTIPIVFAVGSDAVELGLAASLNRPGGNATGISYFTNELGPKRLGLLRELFPGAKTIAVLSNPANPSGANGVALVQAGAAQIGQKLLLLQAGTSRDIDAAFEAIKREGADALLIVSDAMFTARRVQIVSLATRHAIPGMYTSREYAAVGGLASYGVDLSEVCRQLGLYAGRILKGAKPTDLPVMRPSTFQFVINLQAARTLGLEVPPMLSARADEVIE